MKKTPKTDAAQAKFDAAAAAASTAHTHGADWHEAHEAATQASFALARARNEEDSHPPVTRTW